MRLRNPAQQTIAELALKYGKLFEVSEKIEDTVTARYRYDEEVRLLEAARGGNVETFSVDGNANRISHSAVAGAWTYNAADQLITRGTNSYEYDLAGNLTKRTDSSSSGAAREMRFVYDAFSRLAEVRDATNALIARYIYDPFDRRLWKDVSLISPGVGGGASTRTVFFHSAEGLLAEADAAGQLTRSYGWRSDQYFGTEPLFIRTRQGANWSTGYYHHDQLGTPIRVTDASGAITWKADVNVFGQASIDGARHLRITCASRASTTTAKPDCTTTGVATTIPLPVAIPVRTPSVSTVD